MKYLLVFILVLSSFTLKAEDDFPRFRISAGIGFPSTQRYANLVEKSKLFNPVFKLYKNDSGFNMFGVRPLHIKFEYRLKWWIGLGLNVNYNKYGCTFYGVAFDPNLGKVPNKITITYRNISTNIRANIYLINPEKNDTRSEVYLGMGLGYKSGKLSATSEYKEFTPSITLGRLYNMGVEATIGYRYNFTKNLAIYSELGFAKSILQLGLTGSF